MKLMFLLLLQIYVVLGPWGSYYNHVDVPRARARHTWEYSRGTRPACHGGGSLVKPRVMCKTLFLLGHGELVHLTNLEPALPPLSIVPVGGETSFNTSS